MAKTNPASTILVLIGIDKLLKAMLLLTIAAGAHRMVLAEDKADLLQHWVRMIRVDPGNHRVHAIISRATGISLHRLHEIQAGSYAYACVYVVEGVGLVLRKRWAEWVTAIATAAFIPLEVWELFHGHRHLIKLTVLILNVAIVVFLVWRVRRELEVEQLGK